MPAKKNPKVDGRGNTGKTTPAWPRYLLQILTLWILAFFAYSNSFDAGLIFDNAAILTRDPRITAATPGKIGQIFGQGYWYDNTTSGLYRPLTTLSYLFNYAGLEDRLHPQGYHVVNLALHEVNIALVYALGLTVLGGTSPAFALAALWALHPLLTESVTNIVGRADLLAGFGVLAGLLCSIRALKASGGKRIAWLAGLVVAQTVGIFSKESAAILPGLIALYDLLWPRTESWRRRLIPYALLALPFGAFFLLRSQLGTHLVVPFSENPLIGAGFWTARMTAIKVIGKFIWLFLWPARLTADYSFNAVPLFAWRPWQWEDAKAVIAFAACAGLLATAIRCRRRNPPLAFFLGFFFIALAPTANLLLTIGSIMAERFMYLPAIGLAGCMVIAIREGTGESRPAIAWAAIGALCLAFGLRTYARNFDWHDDTSLWTSAIAAYPNTARAHNNLGNVMLAKSDWPNAVAEFEAALRIRRDDAEAHYNLGKAYSQIPGRLPDAIAEYEAALRYRPDYSPKLHETNAHVSLGNALAQMPDRTADAIAQYEDALKVDPNSAEAYYNLGNALARTPDRMNDAIEAWQSALRIQPELAEAHYNLGVVLSRMPGRMPDAIAQFEQAIRFRPDFADAHENLGMALLQVPGRMADGIAELQASLRIRPDARKQQMLDQLRAQQKY